jgi:uncharacterized cysteine cluster protein YcgN (CxxCxxCC family)
MYRFGGKNLLGTNMHNVCTSCAYRFMAENRERPKEFLDIVKSLTSLHEKGIINEKAYQDLIRLMVSMYVQGVIESKVTRKLDEALCEKLSPHNLLEAFV